MRHAHLGEDCRSGERERISGTSLFEEGASTASKFELSSNFPTNIFFYS